MGCSFSSRSSSSSSVSNMSIRLVHLNGHIEEFDHPVTVYEVTRISPKHFVCTPAQLLSAYSKPLVPDTLLKPGQIYFLLPFSVFQSAVSPEDFKPAEENVTEEQGIIDLAGLMKKSTKSRSWKPILATIRERSFTRRSESDLQEKS